MSFNCNIFSGIGSSKPYRELDKQRLPEKKGVRVLVSNASGTEVEIVGAVNSRDFSLKNGGTLIYSVEGSTLFFRKSYDSSEVIAVELRGKNSINISTDESGSLKFQLKKR